MDVNTNESNDTKQEEQKQKNKEKKILSSGSYEIPKAIVTKKGKKLFKTKSNDMLRALKKLGFSISAALKEGEVTKDMLENCTDDLFTQLDRYVEYVEHNKWTSLNDELGKSVAAYNKKNPIAALDVLSHLNADKKGHLTIDGKKSRGIWAPELSTCVTRLLSIYKVNKETNNGFFSSSIKT